MVVFTLQAEWSIGVELVVGPDIGISYLTEKALSVSTLLLSKKRGFILKEGNSLFMHKIITVIFRHWLYTLLKEIVTNKTHGARLKQRILFVEFPFSTNALL